MKGFPREKSVFYPIPIEILGVYSLGVIQSEQTFAPRLRLATRHEPKGGSALAGVDVLEVSETPPLMTAVAELPYGAGAVSAADLGAALADEVGQLDEEGHRLQVLASRLAQDARPEFEAWFEAGLLLRRASERLAEIVRSIA